MARASLLIYVSIGAFPGVYPAFAYIHMRESLFTIVLIRFITDFSFVIHVVSLVNFLPLYVRTCLIATTINYIAM